MDNVIAKPIFGNRWHVGRINPSSTKIDEKWIKENTGIEWENIEKIEWLPVVNAWIIFFKSLVDKPNESV